MQLPGFLRPPVAIARTQWKLLFALMVVSATTSYQGSITTQAITFIVDEFGSSKAQQGRALAFIRSDIIFTLIMLRVADRIGRRRTLLTCAAIGPVLTALCSTASSLPAFTGLQIVARSFVTATAILLSVMIVEEFPAAARAWGSSFAVAASAVGSALTLVVLPLAGASLTAWRQLYLVPLVGLIPVLLIRRLIPESSRFEVLEAQRSLGRIDSRWLQHRNRLFVIALWVLLMGMFTTPARQFLNDYLREDRGLSAGQLSRFGLLTNLPGTFGVLLGGAISDRRGRRLTASVGLFGYAIASSIMFLTNGPVMWVSAMVASLAGAFALPALAIMVTELFPTELRSRASGFGSAMNRGGSAIGLLLVGQFSDQFTIGRTMVALAGALIIGVTIMLLFLPETAHRELEDLNPR